MGDHMTSVKLWGSLNINPQKLIVSSLKGDSMIKIQEDIWKEEYFNYQTETFHLKAKLHTHTPARPAPALTSPTPAPLQTVLESTDGPETV